VLWHKASIGSVQAYVCSWGWTGNGRPTVKLALLTHYRKLRPFFRMLAVPPVNAGSRILFLTLPKLASGRKLVCGQSVLWVASCLNLEVRSADLRSTKCGYLFYFV
jgi:hypothetical protein